MQLRLTSLPAALALAAGILAGCGGNGAAELALQGSETAPPREVQGFRLHVLPESFIDCASAEMALEITETNGATLVNVNATNAQGLKALYFELSYDPERWSPLEATASGLLASTTHPVPVAVPAQVIELSANDEPGRLLHGQVLAGYTGRAGFSGSGAIASVRFARRPFDHIASRTASQVPVSDDARTLATYSSFPVQGGEEFHYVYWSYNNPGDYDQNGEVGIADLTPLGQHFEQRGPFVYTLSTSVIDGNHDGLIGIADITPIGANFGNRVSGFNFYRSMSPDDYPLENTSPNGAAELLGSLSLEDMNPDPDFRNYRGFAVETPQPDAYYWLRPTDGASEGTPSILVRDALPSGAAPQVQLTSNVGSGPLPLTVRFTAQANDPDGQIASVVFNVASPGSGNLFHTGAQQEFVYTFEEAGIHEVTVNVTDNFGNWSSDVLEITAGS